MEGKLNMEIPEASNDEIGTLIEIFGATTQGLEEIIVDISNTLESIANKDLTVETQANIMASLCVSNRQSTILFQVWM